MAVGKKTGGGSRKGKPNKVTATVREAIAKLADGHADKFIGWIDQVAIDDPKGAAELYLKAIEYHIPKLARSEHTGKDGGPLQHKVSVEFV